MSQENVDLVRRTMEEFNHGGPAAVVSSVERLPPLFPKLEAA